MAFGFQTFNADGTEVFSTLDSTWTLLWTGTAPENASYTWNSLPTLPTVVITRQMINQVTGDSEAYVHTLTWTQSNGTLVATAPDSENTSETFIMIFGK